MKNEKTMSMLTVAIWVVQFLAEALTFGIIWRLDMLPGKYLLLVAALFVIMWLVTGALLFRKGKNKSRKSADTRRVTALILAAVVVLGCAVMSGMISELHQTMNTVTESNGIKTMMTVYVRADDPAQQIGDAAGYAYAILDDLGTTQTKDAVATLQNELGVTLSTSTYASSVLMAEALYSGEVDAILMSNAYVAFLVEQGGFPDFETKTKVLQELTIVTQAQTNTPNNNDEPLTTRPVVGADKENAPGGNHVEIGSIVNTPFLVYLSGNDARSTVLTTGRSDVNILAVVNPTTKQVLLVNTPRDYFVVHPYSSSGMRDKLTHLGMYGADCSIQGLEQLYSERIDFYGQVNFTGFKTLVDAIGGITVHSSESFVAGGDVYIEAGENYLNGEQALKFARQRYGVTGGDNGRGQNQMKVIKAVIQKMVSGAIITNYSDILASMEGMFVTDLSMDDISRLVKMQLSDMASWNIVSYSVTGTNSSSTEIYSAPGQDLYVMIPDEGMVEFGSKLIDRVIAGDILTDADTVYPG